MYIGFVGYSSNEFNKQKAEEIIKNIFKELDKEDIVVSGATNLGIIGLIYEEASKSNMKTIGIMCKLGYDYELFPVDELVVVGNDWGDESTEFINSIEKLYRIGGGKQSREEVKMAKKIGIDVEEFDL